eukprot:6039268-Lingulodinium_polyedra.AAC.1
MRARGVPECPKRAGQSKRAPPERAVVISCWRASHTVDVRHVWTRAAQLLISKPPTSHGV